MCENGSFAPHSSFFTDRTGGFNQLTGLGGDGFELLQKSDCPPNENNVHVNETGFTQLESAENMPPVVESQQESVAEGQSKP